MEVSEDFTITLRLGQQPLSITIRRTDEEAYRAAERLVNQRYNSYASQYPSLGNETYFVDSMRRMLETVEETLGTEKAQ